MWLCVWWFFLDYPISSYRVKTLGLALIVVSIFHAPSLLNTMIEVCSNPIFRMKSHDMPYLVCHSLSWRHWFQRTNHASHVLSRNGRRSCLPRITISPFLFIFLLIWLCKSSVCWLALYINVFSFMGRMIIYCWCAGHKEMESIKRQSSSGGEAGGWFRSGEPHPVFLNVCMCGSFFKLHDLVNVIQEKI